MHRLVKTLGVVVVLTAIFLLAVAFFWWFSLVNQWPHQVVLPR